MKKRYLILAVFAAVATGLFLYNYWSYSCGRCNAASLWAISVPAAILIGINCLAFVTLGIVKTRQQRYQNSLHCGCGTRLHRDWQFCPGCGIGHQ